MEKNEDDTKSLLQLIKVMENISIVMEKSRCSVAHLVCKMARFYCADYYQIELPKDMLNLDEFIFSGVWFFVVLPWNSEG